MAKNNEGKIMGLGAEVAREGYEESVVSRMVGRAGATVAAETNMRSSS